jgi:signal transduction histidine kinase
VSGRSLPRLPLPGSLRGRITLAALAALVLGGAIAGALLLAAVERDGRDAVDKDLRTRAENTVRSELRPGPGPGALRGAPPFAEGPGGPPPDAGLLRGSGSFVQVVYNGQVVQQRGDVPAKPAAVPDEDGYATIRIDGTPWRSLTVSAPDSPLRLQLLSTLAPVDDRVAHIRRLVLLLGLAALAITGLAAWAFTTVAVRPLGRLRAGAERVSGAKDLDTRLPEDEGPFEVRSLAQTLNAMLGRLRSSSEATERALHATRRFAADAGHELRTPLASLRANLDSLERNPGLSAGERAAIVGEMTAEQDRMVHLLGGLQALARGEAAESLPRENVELGDVLDAAMYSARSRHPDVRFELQDAGQDTAMNGWAGGLRVLVDNLLDNAALHGRPGGLVRVQLRRDHRSLVLGVDDDGPGIPPAERERVLEAFARGNGATAPGTGLGLAIVTQQVALHEGTMRLGDSDLGGLAVELRLPAA